MRRSWRGLLLMLLVAEALLLVWFIRIQPMCEPCITGAPCPPCISDDQRMLALVAGLLPVGVLLAQLVLFWRERHKP